ncbi:Uncharacterised protein [Yersinia massiliensis]|uniref:phage tail fiber protein n=1 Tax=Yersinia massiliensis TaxID=419257 RepID=UPI0005E56788|nr:hypothetical protein [Yersinia massiliensis]CNI67396.1 Uncharacterised protein [Yersinia massiliensis]
MSTITSANSVFSLAITNLYATPQILEGYSTDDAFSTDALDITETVMGIDGKLSGGFVFNPTNQTITIMPDSPSLVIFETWVTAMKTMRETLTANATIQLPALGRKYTLTKGFLVSAKTIPDVKKTLQPTPFVIRWEKVTGETI